jgi:hypothetical protein
LFHLKTTVAGVDVSTIALSYTGFGTGYETCLFYPSGTREIESEVVRRYASQEQAEAGHAEWVEKLAAAAE